MVTKVLLDKMYDGESIVDVERDVSEAFMEVFTPVVRDIPVDEYNIQQGVFNVCITWSPE